MKRREQALLFLRKAAQDESLLDAVLEFDSVSDEVIGFHCQQAAEKIIWTCSRHLVRCVGTTTTTARNR